MDFVFVASAKAAGANNYGEIDVFEINSESGRMRQIPTSPFPSGGRNPVAEAVSADYQNLFVVNQDDNTIVQFVIGSDGKLYPIQHREHAGNLSAGHRDQQVQRLRGGYLPAAAASAPRPILARVPSPYIPLRARHQQLTTSWPGNAGDQRGQ